MTSHPVSALILLGAEGLAEVREEPWIEETYSEEDHVRFLAENDLTPAEFQSLSMDRTGRPYFLTRLAPEAPLGILERVRGIVRTVRLIG